MGKGGKIHYKGGGGEGGLGATDVLCFSDASTKHCATGYLVHACLPGERANENNVVEFGRHRATPGAGRSGPALRPLPLELAGFIEILRAAARFLDIGQAVDEAAASSSSPAGEIAGGASAPPSENAGNSIAPAGETAGSVSAVSRENVGSLSAPAGETAI